MSKNIEAKMDVWSKEWVQRGPEWNTEWMERNPSHILAATWRTIWNESRIAARTSCEVTAEVMREQTQPDKKWIIVDPSDASWDTIRKKYPVFQISFGEEWTCPDHILTVVGEYAIQSYFLEYTLRVDPLTSEWIDAIKNPSSKSWQTITFVEANNNNNTYSVFYWVPV